MQPTFTKEERDVIIKLVTDVKINILDQSAVAFVEVLQSIAKKTFLLSQPQPYEDKQELPARKSGKKSEAPKDSNPSSF